MAKWDLNKLQTSAPKEKSELTVLITLGNGVTFGITTKQEMVMTDGSVEINLGYASKRNLHNLLINMAELVIHTDKSNVER